MELRNVGILTEHYTASQPRRQLEKICVFDKYLRVKIVMPSH